MAQGMADNNGHGRMDFRFVLGEDKAPFEWWRGGEPVEGFHYPHHHPHGQGRTQKEESFARLANVLLKMTVSWGTHLLWSRVGLKDKDGKRKNQAQLCKPMHSTNIFFKSANTGAESGLLVANDYMVRGEVSLRSSGRFGSHFLHFVYENFAKPSSQKFSFNSLSQR